MSKTLITPERAPRSFLRDAGVVDLSPFINLARVQSMFNEVPIDAYVPDGTRCKSIARVFLNSAGLTLAPHGCLFQDGDTNPVHGDLERNYPPMPIELLIELALVIQYFGALANLNPQHEVLVQAQRVTATAGDDGMTGRPVLEGWHRDAVDVLGIVVVARHNIEGGVSLLSRDKDIVHEAICLSPGQMMFIEDGAWFHNVTPIRPLNDALIGLRDIVILTSPASRPPT